MSVLQAGEGNTRIQASEGWPEKSVVSQPITSGS
jgi:hypothetical protein